MNRLIFTVVVMLAFVFGANAQKPEMVQVQGGTYKMGNASTTQYKGDPDEKPVHNVSVKSFFIGKYEVTVKDYKMFINDASAASIFSSKREHKMPAPPDSTWLAEHPDTKKYYPLPSQKWWGWQDNLPMQHVTWYDAVAYCNWLSQKEGLQVCYSENEDGGIDVDLSKNGYRLPTEAEWEFAARGGNQSKGTFFAGSNDPKAVCIYDETSMLKGPQKVGSKAPNELGIYDMCGNVWEWCTDYYNKDFYAKSPIDNPANIKEYSKYRVLRGGSWHYQVEYATVTSKDGPEQYYTNWTYGFRIAKN